MPNQEINNSFSFSSFSTSPSPSPSSLLNNFNIKKLTSLFNKFKLKKQHQTFDKKKKKTIIKNAFTIFNTNQSTSIILIHKLLNKFYNLQTSSNKINKISELNSFIFFF